MEYLLMEVWTHCQMVEIFFSDSFVDNEYNISTWRNFY